ncbi:MAG: hypothetical protein Q7W29_12910 [bacterium]|nr:hypothetical protein [bacterium]
MASTTFRFGFSPPIILALAALGTPHACLAAPDQDMMIGISINRLILAEQDMADTYGTVAIPGVTAVAAIADHSRFVFTAGCGFAKGSPFYDVTGYEGDNEARLKTILMQFGMQGDLSRNTRLRVYWGLSAELARIHERLPAYAGSPDHDDFDGWGTGLRFTFGPEWRSADAARAIGLTMGWGTVGGAVSHEGHRHEVNLSGAGLQCHVLWRM